MSFYYQTHGLTIESDLKLPMCNPLPDSQLTDVKICLGEVSIDGLIDPVDSGRFFQAKPNILWLGVPDVVRLIVTNGNKITYSPEPTADPGSVALFTMGTGLGALLHQRGVLALHAGAVSYQGGAVVFMGASGVGKSTTVTGLMRRGYHILTDDICAIEENGCVQIGHSYVKLWTGSASQLNIGLDGMTKIRPQVEKYAYPLADQLSANSIPLKKAFILESWNKDYFDIQQLSGSSIYEHANSYVYRWRCLRGLGLDGQNLKLFGKLLGGMEVTKISRPFGKFMHTELLDIIEQELTSIDN